MAINVFVAVNKIVCSVSLNSSSYMHANMYVRNGTYNIHFSLRRGSLWLYVHSKQREREREEEEECRARRGNEPLFIFLPPPSGLLLLLSPPISFPLSLSFQNGHSEEKGHERRR